MVSHDTWMSNVLSCTVLQVHAPKSELQARETILKSSLESLPERDPFFAFLKLSPADISLIEIAESSGFRLVDTNLVFEKVSQPFNSSFHAFVRYANAADEADVVEIAERSFTFSRFHLDPHFSPERASRIKMEWARNFFRGERGQNLIVYQQGESVVGFTLVLQKPGEATIDLIAVHPDAQRLGGGKQMVQFLEQSLPAETTIKVGTQLANTGSVLFYQRLGFQLHHSSYIFHRHHDGTVCAG